MTDPAIYDERHVDTDETEPGTTNAPHDVTWTPAGWEITDADGNLVYRTPTGWQNKPKLNPGETLWQLFTVLHTERIEVKP